MFDIGEECGILIEFFHVFFDEGVEHVFDGILYFVKIDTDAGFHLFATGR